VGAAAEDSVPAILFVVDCAARVCCGVHEYLWRSFAPGCDVRRGLF
jgi:hypothetical protein